MILSSLFGPGTEREKDGQNRAGRNRSLSTGNSCSFSPRLKEDQEDEQDPEHESPVPSRSVVYPGPSEPALSVAAPDVKPENSSPATSTGPGLSRGKICRWKRRMQVDWETLMRSTVQEVFKKRLGYRVEPAPCNPEESKDFPIACSLGILGRFNGMLHLYLGTELARQVTTRFLGGSGAEDGQPLHLQQSQLNSVLGAITNLIGDRLNQSLREQGFPCVLTPVSMVRGSRFSIEPTASSERWTVRFLNDRLPFVMEVRIRPQAFAY